MEAQACAARRACVSYSRRSDFSIIHALREAANLSKNNQWSIHYDETDLQASRSIAAFMEKLSEAEKVIIVLSPGYFSSPYCLEELLHIYRKRAHEMTPVVVFVDGLRSSDVNLEKVLADFRQQSITQNKDALYGELVNELPSVLFWLLGPDNEKLGGWDIKFHTCKPGLSLEEVARNIIDDLNRDEKVRFSSLSWECRWACIKREVAAIVNEVEFEAEFALLRDCVVSGVGGVGSRAVRPLGDDLEALSQEGVFLEYCLKAVNEWLKLKVLQKSVSGNALRRCEFVGLVQELLGWLLYAAIDNKRLHGLINALNWKGDEAELLLLGENEVSVQLLVSTIAKTATLYRYVPDDKERRLKGRGELTLNDQGIDCNNYAKAVQKEQDFFKIAHGLYEQISDNPVKHKTQSSLDGAMSAVLDNAEDYYLFFEKNLLSISCMRELRTAIGVSYPTIQQVVQDEAHSPEQDYFREGVRSGYLDEMTRAIYATLHHMGSRR